MLTTSHLGSRTYGTKCDHHIRPAGITTSLNDTAEGCMTWEDRPQTPDEIKKYRESTVHIPGHIVRHPGVAEDEVPKGPFGAKTVSLKGESVEGSLKTFPASDLGQWLKDRSESVYASSKREPLGRSFLRGHRLPPGLGSDEPFGIKSGAQEKEAACLARQITFPDDSPDDDCDPAIRNLYVRSHGSYDPGEQRKRHYDWQSAGVDPVRHTFGAVDKDNYREGVKKALNRDLDPSVPKAATVVNKKVEDFHAAHTDVLGKAKTVCHGERNFPSDLAFGTPSVKFPEDGVDKLITGYYTEEEQKPDADLGKSLREGWRNCAPEDKVFGLPTVRLDVPSPPVKSVANVQNYGNDPDALQLIHPTVTAVRGVNEEHYLQVRTADELRDLMINAGISVEDEEFTHIFDHASKLDGQANACSIESFMRTRLVRLKQSQHLT